MKAATLSNPATSSVKTGVSNTRLNSQPAAKGIAVSLDWLQFTGLVFAGELLAFFETLEEMTGEKIDLTSGKPTHIGRTWANSGRSPNGIRVAWDDAIDRNGNVKVFISIPGGVLSALASAKIWSIAKYLRLSGFNCSRLDLTVDDFEKRLKKETVLRAIRANNRAKFRKQKYDDSLSEEGGWTIYFGKRESARFTRLYDKDAESKGKIKSTRLETQFNAKTANIVLDKWLDISPEYLGDDWEEASAKYIFKSVVGSIDFVDRASNPEEKNIKRLKRLGWWQRFCDLAQGTIYHTAPTPKQSLQKAVGWMKRSVMKSMKCVLEAFGEQVAKKWLEHALNEAGMTLSPSHKKRMQQYASEWKQYQAEVDFGVPGYA